MAACHSQLLRALFVVTASAALSLAAEANPTPIRFTLDGPFEGPAAPVLVAADKGYFQQQGLDLRVEPVPAGAAIEPIARVAAGGFQMGIADLNVLIRWRDQNPAAPVRPVFIVQNRPPYAIVGRKSRALAAPKDLEGKRLAVPPGSASGAQWPLFARLTDIDPARVKVEPIGVAVREPILAAGQVDAVAGAAYRTYVDLKDRGVPIGDILVWRMPDYGMQLYGSAIIVNDKYAAQNPQAVSGFLDAFVRGLQETIDNPGGAVAAVMQRNPIARADVELERLQMAIAENILTPEVRENGFGSANPARLQAGIDQMELTQRFKNKPTPAQAFDASFLPPAIDRRVN